jgi:hypothetical protein
MTSYILSLIIAIITFGMALLQLSLTFGAPFGEYVLGGRDKVLPKKMRYVSATFSLIFVIIGLVYLQRGDMLYLGFNTVFINVVTIINTLFLAFACVSHAMLTKSKKEIYLMTPLSVLQFVCCVILFL